MDPTQIIENEPMTGKVAVITGAAGVLCSAISRYLFRKGIHVFLLDISLENAQKLARELEGAGGQSFALECNVLDKDNLEAALKQSLSHFGRIDFLINGAGGNKKQATTNQDTSFFDLSPSAVQSVFDLNFQGTFIPSQVFGRQMADQGYGTILNISSMNAFRPLTRIPAYSAAKAAVSNFTQWLAVHMAQEYSPNIRVNAIAPGFFLTEQNRFLLTDEKTGELTERGRSIISHTPMGRFGAPEDLLGAVEWLLSPGSQFVTGVVIPIDGGFSAFSGV